MKLISHVRAILTYFRLSDFKNRPETFQAFKFYWLELAEYNCVFGAPK